MQASGEAAAIAQTRREEALRTGSSFVTETTFSHPSKLALVQQASAAGFRVVLYHVGVDRVELSLARVIGRVSEGQHDVPEDKIRKRFELNQPLIRSAALAADLAFIYDNSRLNQLPQCLILFRDGEVIDRISNIPAWAATLYAQELSTTVVRPRRWHRERSKPPTS